MDWVEILNNESVLLSQRRKHVSIHECGCQAVLFISPQVTDRLLPPSSPRSFQACSRTVRLISKLQKGKLEELGSASQKIQVRFKPEELATISRYVSPHTRAGKDRSWSEPSGLHNCCRGSDRRYFPDILRILMLWQQNSTTIHRS